VDLERFRAIETRFWASLGARPTEHTLKLRHSGTDVRVQELGNGPPVLFIHGATNGGSSWSQLAARLPGYRCLLLDRPGCGLSEAIPRNRNDAAGLARFGDSLAIDVLDALAIERASLVTTSFGGYFGLRAAAAHPARIDRVLEFGWPVGAPPGRVPMALRLTAIPGLARVMGLIPPNEPAVRSMLRNIGLKNALESGAFSREALDWYVSLLRDTPTLRNDLKSGPPPVSFRGAANRQVLLPPDLLTAVRAPVHFVWGEDDVFGGAEIARAFVPRISGATLDLMSGTGHAPWMDDLDRAVAAAETFLAAA
jgi:pimeloyl-ACP methyl ester carboxylesterase